MVKSKIQKRTLKTTKKNENSGTKFSFTCKGIEFTMTDSQRLFCMKYVELGFNATAAALAAGYSEKNAGVSGCALLKYPNLKGYIDLLKDDIALQVGKSAVDIAREYAKIGFANIKNLYDENGNLKQPHELDDDDAAAISSVEYDDIVIGKEKVGVTTKMKRYDKVLALDKYAKMIGADGVTKIAQTDSNGEDIIEITNADDES